MKTLLTILGLVLAWPALAAITTSPGGTGGGGGSATNVSGGTYSNMTITASTYSGDARGLTNGAGTNLLVNRSTRFASRIVNGNTKSWQKPRNSWLMYPVSTNLVDQNYISNAVVVLKNSGLQKHGWTKIDLNDGWADYQTNRPVWTNHLHWNPDALPDGIPWLANYCHTNGVDLMVYQVAGPTTVGARMGSGTNAIGDAEDLLSWGVDGSYFSCDTVSPGDPQWTATDGSGINGTYELMAGAYSGLAKPFHIFATVHQVENWMREALYCVWPQPPGGLDDYDATSYAVTNLFQRWAYCEQYLKMTQPGFFVCFQPSVNIATATGDVRTNRFQIFFGLSCLSASPMQQGGIGQAAAYSFATNTDLLNIQQDNWIRACEVLPKSGDVRYLIKPLANGDVAVGFLNTNLNLAASATTVTLTWNEAQLVVPNGIAAVRDCMARTNMPNATNSLTISCAPSSLNVFRLSTPSSGSDLGYITNTQTGVTLSGVLNQNPIGTANVNYGTNGFVGGQNSSVGPLATNAMAFGQTMNVTGPRAIGLGGGLVGGTVSGADAVGMGNAPTASGSQSFAFGNATASGIGAYAFGPQSLTSGNYAFSFGYKARATAQGAFMINCGVTADLFQSNTIADSFKVWAANGHRFVGSAIIGDGSGVTNVASTNIVGTVAGSEAIAGTIGEYVQSLVAAGGALAVATGVTTNVTSISLTAGDWDVEASVLYNFNTTIANNLASAGISTTSKTIPTDGSEVKSLVASTGGLGMVTGVTVPRKRINVTSTTTVYLCASATFDVSCSVYGSINARRVR